jgi:DNA-3-methyladenine glycosylase II
MVNVWYMTAMLSQQQFRAALAHLAGQDTDLAAVLDAFGEPLARSRPPGFATLVLLILEQQVSLASARATFDRLAALVGDITPGRILAQNDDDMRAAGLSRQKIRYARALAETVTDGGLDLDALDSLDDAEIAARLTAVIGIGAWTADVYLLTVLQRPDIWPARDLALAVAAHEVKRLESRPDEAALIALGEQWRPYRTAAARILWHYYLNTKRNKSGARRT